MIDAFTYRPPTPDQIAFDPRLSLPLADIDAEIDRVVGGEEDRQRFGIELIASENFTSRAVRVAVGSVLTNKYAEGLPHKRYYGGCEWVDQAEDLARDRAKLLFGADHANVQPHAGSQANMAAYLALINPRDTILAMRLDQGGHLTHGSPVNFSGQLFNAVAYGVDAETEQIDYDEVAQKAREFKPRVIVAGATAYSRYIDFARFAEIASSVDAKLVVDMAHIAGLVAAGLHPDPVPFADVVTSTTHKTMRGPRGGFILSKAEHAAAIDKTVFPKLQGGPLEHVIAGKAVTFAEAMRPEFRVYQERVVENARVFADKMASLGYRIVSGGTDNHLFLVDLRSKGITGKQAQAILGLAGLTTNKNGIPFDPESPFVTSGLRLGSPAMTTRGFRPEDFEQTAVIIDRVIKSKGDEKVIYQTRQEVREMAGAFPMPGDLPSATVNVEGSFDAGTDAPYISA